MVASGGSATMHTSREDRSSNGPSMAPMLRANDTVAGFRLAPRTVWPVYRLRARQKEPPMSPMP